MPLQYGLNFTASDLRNILEQNDKQQNGIRSWRQLFGNASLGQQAQSDALKTAYSDIIAQAYKANFEQQNAIANSGLSAGAVKQGLALSRQELADTYNNYMQNYASNLNDINTAYQEEISGYDEALTQRAQNYADLYNSAYNYLSQELFGASYAENDLNTATPVYADEGKNPEVTGYSYDQINHDYLTEHGLDWLKDENGNLLSWEKLGPMLVDGSGGLTEKGTQFFEQLFNARPDAFLRTTEDGETVNVKSFGQWLSETNTELYDWMVSGDAFNYTFDGTNLGTAKAMAGLDSTDDDAPGTWTESQVKKEGNTTPSKGTTYEGSPFEGANPSVETAQKYNKWVQNEIKDTLDGITEFMNSLKEQAINIGIDTSTDAWYAEYLKFARYLQAIDKKAAEMTDDELKELYQMFLNNPDDVQKALDKFNKANAKENPKRRKITRPSGF